jgi:hypothetical protein
LFALALIRRAQADPRTPNMLPRCCFDGVARRLARSYVRWPLHPLARPTPGFDVYNLRPDRAA